MKNRGVFQVLKKGDIYKIFYIEKGETLVEYPNEFAFYEEGTKYIKDHKEELDKVVTDTKEEERKRIEKEEEERKAKEAAERAKKEEKEKKKQEKKVKKEKNKEERKKKREETREKIKDVWSNGWVKFTSGFLVAAMLLTGGHFLGKGISKAIKDNKSNKPTSSQTGSTNPTESTEPTISIKNDVETTITYEEIYNTESFEKMVAEFAKPYVDNKVSLTTEDLLKFASIVNIDRLVEENPEFAKELFGTQTAEEYLNDAAKTIGMTQAYNRNMWKKNKNTDNFIWISKAIPEGDSQKEKMVELEGYVIKIAKAAADKNEEEVNKLTYKLIESLTLTEGSLNALDDGVEFGAQLYFALINNSIAGNYLKQEYRDYFETRSSSEQNASNIFTVYNKCINNGKVRTK
ncbi:MAG: hypothetical protein IJE89_03795 [Bacilli bacterium]|nr:hypothetical protein [Bacilli bacterium]